ncbi:response regulator transcription factor [Vitiosangium sp. GDMCC 1.1324]|uniref:LuxR C-terminal-related transcriptional regulator n=1 Tax=Vitiosangium sp. (strain GDMCC 1.1324) TaxID=2138576 RepID=UPI000D3ABC01|nr:response regulator transcription factor [Vitiosangium sp. GDMCC 1.1324]PTL84680.1 helix-turn-helix transcriptional regulator [Vitiosangium sp. GDMCC 1.1324]
MLDSDASPVRLALVAEDPLARGALSRALSEQGGDLAVIASGTLAEVDASRSEAAPDVVLWDVGLHPAEPGGRLDAPDLGAPVLALVPDESAGEGALSAGARGLLFRDVAPAPLLAALRAVARGLTVFDPALATLRATPRASTPTVTPEGLTPREREVLALLAEGLSNKAIADRLDISEHTAKFHVNAVLAKLGVQRRTEAVVRAARMGLVTL